MLLMEAFNLFWKKHSKKFKDNRAIRKVMRLGFLIAQDRIKDLELVLHITEKENRALKEEIKHLRAYFNTRQ